MLVHKKIFELKQLKFITHKSAAEDIVTVNHTHTQ
jgi:hypothetical protein